VLRFSGDHPMGGEHRGPDEVRAWFERVHGYFPDLYEDTQKLAAELERMGATR
jgi:hypothetical protein